jgi:hypothetical protein
MKTTKRCDALVLQLIVTEYDEHGRPVGEFTSSPMKVFRATVRDVWAEADKAVTAMQQQQKADAIPPSPPALVKGAKKR